MARPRVENLRLYVNALHSERERLIKRLDALESDLQSLHAEINSLLDASKTRNDYAYLNATSNENRSDCVNCRTQELQNASALKPRLQILKADSAPSRNASENKPK